MLFGMENIYSLPQNKKRGQNQQTHPILNAAPPSIVYHARGSGNDSRRTSTRRQRWGKSHLWSLYLAQTAQEDYQEGVDERKASPSSRGHCRRAAYRYQGGEETNQDQAMKPCLAQLLTGSK